MNKRSFTSENVMIAMTIIIIVLLGLYLNRFVTNLGVNNEVGKIGYSIEQNLKNQRLLIAGNDYKLYKLQNEIEKKEPCYNVNASCKLDIDNMVRTAQEIENENERLERNIDETLQLDVDRINIK